MDARCIEDCLSRPPLLVKNNVYYFRSVDVKAEIIDSFDRLKYLLKRYPKLYYFAIDLISPVYRARKPLRQFFALAKVPIVNLGSGNQPKYPKSLNIDMFDYDNVDIVCEINDLPFKDNSISSIMNIAVLEHVREPNKVVAEAYRVLKPGGYIFSVIPFNQPYHASPFDYQRYTLQGIKYLHKQFSIIEAGVYSGPVSALLWITQESIASIFSLGSPFLRNLIYIALVLATFPLKFLDAIVIHLKTSSNVAANFYVIAQKPRN